MKKTYFILNLWHPMCYVIFVKLTHARSNIQIIFCAQTKSAEMFNSGKTIVTVTMHLLSLS